MSKTPFGRVRFFLLLGLLSLFAGTASALPPRARNIFISGNGTLATASANPGSGIVRAYTGMKEGQTLRVWYTYVDPENNPESGTTFQWYTYSNSSGAGKTAIAGATGNTYTIVTADVGKHIGVEVRPRNATDGFGATYEWRPFDASNPNPVYNINANCLKPTGSGVPTPGNLVLSPSASLCSPRSLLWQVQYTGINWRNGFTPKILINWGDGINETLDPGLVNTITSVKDVGLYNPMITKVDTFNLTNTLNQNWRVEQPHTFDYTIAGRTVSATANEKCTYTMTTTWGIGTFTCIVNGFQTQKFVVWDKESNTNLGTLDMGHTAGTGGFENPVGANITDICPRDRTAIRIDNTSDFNCTPAGIVESANPNDQGRWVQFVYGTNTTNQFTTGAAANELITIAGLGSFTAAQLPVYGPVVYQATGTAAFGTTANVQVPVTATAGQVMTITMRVWNTCHPFDNNTFDGNGLNPDQSIPTFNIYTPLGSAPSPLGGPPFYANSAPVTTTYDIRITNAPPPPTVTFTANHCDTDADNTFTFNTTHTQANSTLRWYSDAPLTDLEKSSTTSNTYNPISEGTAPLLNKATTNTQRTISYYVTEQWPGANGCLSLPQTMTINITDTNNGGTIDHPNEIGTTSVVAICTGGDPAAFTNATSASGGNGTPNYQWQSTTTAPGTAGFTDIAGATSATYDPPSGITTTTWYRRKVSSGFCADAFSNTFQIRVDVAPTGGTIGNPQTLCAGVTDPSAITSVAAGGGGNGTPTYSWQMSIDNFGADINTIAGQTGATYDPPVLTQTTYYRRVNTSGVCSPNFAYSNVIQMTVQQPITPGTISNDQVICSGQTPVGLTGQASTGGNGTPTYQWEISTTSPGTSGFTNVGGATGQNYNPPALTQTTWYRRLTTAGVCAAQYSNTVEITVNPLPTVSGVAGGGAVCSGNPAPDITFTFTGTAPFDFTIDVANASGDPDIVVVGHNSNTYTIVDPTPTTNTTYKIISLKDANNCTATTLGGTATVTIGGSAANFDAGPSLAASAVCFVSGGSPNPSLSFSIDVNTVGTYTLVYRANGSGNRTKSFTVNASGDVTAPITFNDTEFDPVGTHTLRLISMTTPAGCQTVLTNNISFTVNPLPQGVNKTVTAGCSAYLINIDPFTTSVATAAGGNNVASTFAWTANYNGLTGMPVNGTGNISGTLTNPGNTVLNAVFTVTPTSTATPACPGATFTITVPVNPVPAIADMTATICSGSAFSITPTNGTPAGTIVPAGTTYTWTVAANANITGASNQVTGVAAIGQTLTNITNIPQAIRYTVTPKAGAGVGGCTGTPFFVDVTVNPTPKIANQTAAICSGTAFNITPANAAPGTIVPNNTTYSWPTPVVTGGITGGSAQTGQTTIGQTLTNASTSPQTATYTITPTSGAAGSCVGPTFTVTVTVNPIPRLSSTLTPAGICTGTFSYTPTSLTSGATFAWSRPNIPGINESASSGTGPISETLTNPTTAAVDVTYTIITTANSCSNTGQDVVVRVFPTPLPNPIIGPANVCVGTNPFFYSVTQRAGSTYSWEIPASFTVEAAGGGVVAGGGPGAFTSDYFILLKFSTPTPPAGLPIKVIEKSANGCIGSVNTLTIVAANSPPTVPISGGNVFCKGQKGVVFSVPQNSSSTFTWSVSSGATFDGPSAGTNLYQVIVDFDGTTPTAQIDVTETNVTGCPANYPSLVVSLLDAPEINGPYTGSICSGDQPSSVFDLDAHTSVPSTFDWVVKNITGTLTGAFVNDVGTGPLQHTPPLKNVSGANATITYTVTPTASSSPFCKGQPKDIVITVKPEPVMTTISDKDACPLTFVNGATLFPFTSNVSGATFNWTNSNTAIGSAAASGNGQMSFTTADNLTGADITSTITATATAAGCTSSAGNSVSFVFTVKPRPVITSALPDIIVCPGDQVGPIAFAANTAGGETFNWTNDNVAIGLLGAGSGAIVAYTAPNNITGSDRIANISVTGTKNGCTGPARTFRIIIHSKPSGTGVTRAAQCSNVSFTVSSNNITNGMGATSTYTWTRNALPAGLTVVTAGTGTGDITETLRNLTGTTLSASYNVTPRSADNCVGDTYIVTVPINSEPVGSAITRAAQCSNVAFSVSADNISNGMGASSSFTWVRQPLPAGLTQITAGTGTGAIAETLQNLTSGTLNALYTVTPTSSAGCAGASYVVTVPIAPEPVGANITRAAQCSNVAFSVSADNITNGVTGATFTWVRNTLPVGLTVVTAGTGSGPIAETLRNVTAGQLSATYNVTASVGGCTGATYVVTVPVNPEPVGAAVTRAAQCSNVAFSVSADNITNGVAGSTFTWTRNTLPAGLGLVTAGSGSGNIAETLRNTTSATLNATYTVVPTSGAGCVGASYVVTVPINPEPVGANTTASAQCSGVTFNVDPNNITNGLGLTSTFTWVRNALPAGLTQLTAGTGSGIISERLQNLTSSQLSAVYVVTPTSSNGCVGATYNVTVPVNPEPVGADVTRAAQCSNVSFSVSAVNISNGLGATSTYTWVRNTLPAGLVLVTAGTGSGSTITETLRNLTGAQLTASYVVTPKSADNCVGASYVVSVPIDSEPVGADITRAAECSSVGFNVSPDNITNGMGATSTYTWVRQTLPAGLTVAVPGTGTGTISETLKNTTSSQLSAKYTVTPRSAAGCNGTTYVITIPINPEPVGANITRSAQCSGIAFSVSADNITNGLGATSTFTWSRNPLSAGLTVLVAGSGTGAISETLQNLTAGQLTVSYTVTATSSQGCASATYIVSVPINPEPVGADITRAGQCSNVPFSVSADNITNGLGPTSTYTWVRDPLPAGITVVTAGTGSGAIAETLRNTTSASLNAVYTVTATSGAGCVGATYKITVPINPEPVGANITRAAQCSGVAFSLSADNITNGVTGTTFTWVRQPLPAGLTVISGGTGSGNIDETLRNLTGATLNAVYRVTPIVGGCTGATYDVTVPINPEPVGANITRTAQCSNVGFNVSANNITNGVAGVTFTWVRQTLPPGLTEVTAGTGTGNIAETLENLTSVQLSAVYTVTPTSGAGCVGGSYIVTVPVNPEPVGTDITRAAQCSNVAFSVSADNITNGLGATSSYTWVRNALPAGLTQVTAGSGTGNIAETLRNLTGSTLNATYTVTPTSSAGCVGKTYVITVPISPEPVGADITRAAECSNVGFSVSPDNITNGVTGTTFTWVRQPLPVGLTQVTAGTGSGPIAETLRNLTASSLDAKYTVTPTTGGCVGVSYVVTIPVNPEPVGAAITRATQCSNVAFSVSADNVTNGVTGSTFTWVRDNLPVGLSVVTAGTGSGPIAETIRNITSGLLTVTYKVTPTSGAGCTGAVYTISVPINPEPVGGNITRTAQCSDVPFSVDPNNITNGLGASTTFTWVRDPLPAGLTEISAGSGSGMINETLHNATAGQLSATYRVTPTSTAGCVGDVYIITLPISPVPVGADVTRATQCSNVAFSVSAINITNNLGSTSTYTWVRNTLPVGLTAIVSGTGSGPTINETLRNVTGGTLNATYTVTPKSADGCIGAPYVVTVPVESEPVGADITRAAQCSGVMFSVSSDNIQNGMGASSNYTWVRNTLPAGLSVVVSGSGTGSISEMLRNTSGGQLNAQYTVTPRSSGGCVGASYVVTVPINPEPLGSNVTRAAQCSNVAFSVSSDNIANGLGATSTYTWVRNPLPGGLTQVTAGTGTGPIAETLRNLSGVQLTASYVVTPTSAAGCAGGSYTVFVPIDPEPVGADITRAQQCSNVAFSVSPDNITNGMSGVTTYTWVRQTLPAGLTVVSAGTGVGAIAETLANVSGGQLSAVYTVTPKSSSGCSGVPYNITVPVNPEPVGADVTRAAQCSDSPFSVSADNITNGVTGVTFTWTRFTTPAGIVVVTAGSGSGNIAETLKNTGNTTLNVVYRVIPTAGVCPGNPYFVTVPINGEPVVANNLNQDRCSDTPYGRLLATTATSETAASYDIEVISIAAGLTGTRTVGVIGTNLPANAIQNDSYTNHTSAALKVVYRVTPNGVTCIGDPKDIEFTIQPEPVLDVPAASPICSGNKVGITLATASTSISAAKYRLVTVEYSNGGPFSTTAPTRFTVAGTNKVASDEGTSALIFNDEFRNTGLVAVTVRYTIVGISSPNAGSPTGCEGDPTFVTINILPEPDLDNALSPAAVCSGLTIVSGNPGYQLRSDAASVAATRFIIRSITNLAGLTAGPSNSGTGPNKLATAINNDIWINTNSTPQVVTYTIAPVSADGCIGADEDITVTVNPAPAVKANLDRIVCDDAVSGIVLQDNSPTSIAATSYDIISVNIPAGLTANAGNAPLGVTTNVNIITNDRYKNSTNDRIVVSYTVVGISSAGCRGPQKVITLTIEPAIVSTSINTKPAICSGDAVSITFNSPTYSNGDPTNPKVTFSYATLLSGVTGATVGNNLEEGETITDVLVNNTNAPIQVHYRITPRAAAASMGIGCAGAVEDVVVTVEPKPKVNNIASKTICEGTPVNLSLVSPTTPTTGTIKIFVTVTKDPEISGESNGVFFNNNSTIADVLSNSASVTKQITYHLEVRNVDAGNATLCSSTPIDVVVQVTPTPVITPIADFAICSGAPFAPIDIITDTETAIPGSTSISWTVTPNPNIVGESNGAGTQFTQTLINNTNDKQTVVYQIKATNITNIPSCAATAQTLNVTVYPNPKVVGLPTRPAEVCNNGFLSPNPFVLTPSTVAALGTTFDWTFDDGTNPPVMQTNQTQITQSFVNPDPFLSSQSFTITAHLTIPAGDNPKIEPANGVSNVCVNQADATLFVNVAPQVGGDIYGRDLDGNNTQDVFVCKGAGTTVVLEPSGLPNFTVDYTVNGVPASYTGSGARNAAQGIVFNTTGTTTYELLKVTDKYGCSANINKTVVVHTDAVDNTLAVNGPAIGCSPFDAEFTFNEVAGTEYIWHWGDGVDDPAYVAGTSTANKIVTHQYTSTNTNPNKNTDFKISFEAQLDATKFLNGCRKVAPSVTVSVRPIVVAQVFADKQFMCSDETVTLSNETIGATSSHWFYRTVGGATEIDPQNTTNNNSVTFTIPNNTTSAVTTFELVYRPSNGTSCTMPEVVIPIDVYRGIQAGFTNTTPTVYTAGESDVLFTNTSNPIDESQFGYAWDFGVDSNPATANTATDGGGSFDITYTTPGFKTATLTARNLQATIDHPGLVCANVFSQTFEILIPPLVAAFDMAPPEACFPTNVTITHNGAEGGNEILWQLLDQAGVILETNIKEPVFKIPSPGRYTVRLITRNTYVSPVQEKREEKEVIIYDKPTADFVLRPTTVFVPDQEVETYNFSTGATSYQWDFGDGTTTDEEEPKHTYKLENVYEILLIAKNDHGNGVICTDSLIKKVTARQGGLTRVPNAFTPNPNGPSTSTGNQPGANSFNDVFLPQVKGAEEFNMQVFDRWGNLIFESNDSNVGWDGYDRNGKLLPAGVYVYKLTLRLSDGQRTTQVGDITMIR